MGRLQNRKNSLVIAEKDKFGANIKKMFGQRDKENDIFYRPRHNFDFNRFFPILTA